MLKRQGLIESWHDRRIVAGEPIDEAIDVELERADIILLLVSSSFIASDYCYSKEMTRALERNERGEARVVPVIVRNCDWHSALFGRLKAVPKDGKPISSWADPDDAYTDVAREVRIIVEAKMLGSNHHPMPPTQAIQDASVSAPVRQTLPRSGNLRVRQEFSDLDKARFLADAFDYVARYFEGSVGELANRNADIQCDFQRIDRATFTSVIYRNGKQVSACTVRLTGTGSRDRGITYSTDASRTDGTGYNERVSVDSDDQSMHLCSAGMNPLAGGGAGASKLSSEGAAELFWTILMRPLQ